MYQRSYLSKCKTKTDTFIYTHSTVFFIYTHLFQLAANPVDRSWTIFPDKRLLQSSEQRYHETGNDSTDIHIEGETMAFLFKIVNFSMSK